MRRSGFFNAVGGIVRSGSNLLAVVGLIRILGLEEYGLYALIAAIVGFVPVLDGGLGWATMVFVSRELEADDPAAIAETVTITGTIITVLALVVGGLLVLLGPLVMQLFAGLSDAQRAPATLALRFGAVILMARLLQGVAAGVQQAYGRYDLLNALIVGQAMFVAVGSVGLAWLGARTPQLFEFQAGVALAILAANSLVSARLLGRGLQLRWSNTKLRSIAAYSVPTWLTTLGATLFSQADRLIVGGLLGTSALGLYAGITSITQQINAFSALPVQPVMPAISRFRLANARVQAEIMRFVGWSFRVNALIVFGMTAALLAAAPLVLRIVLPQPYADSSVDIFRLATVIYAVYSLNAVGYFVLLVEAPKVTVVVSIGGALLALLLIRVLGGAWGLPGAISGNAGYFLTLLLVILALRRMRELRRRAGGDGTTTEVTPLGRLSA
jgi:O-antigen/teichoic acid export membrane protein